MSCAEKRGKRYRCIVNDCGTITAMKAPFTYENAMKAAIYPIANSTVDAVFWTVHTDLAGPYDAPRMWRDYLDATPYEYICNDGRPMGPRKSITSNLTADGMEPLRSFGKTRAGI